MKILHINNAYLDTPLYQNLYDALAALGFENWVHMTFRERNREKAEGYRDREGFGMTEVSSNWLVRWLVFPKSRRVLRDVIPACEGVRPDLVHAHSLLSDGLVAYGLKKRFGIPYVVAFRYTDELMLRYNMTLKSAARRVLMEAKQVVFLSPSSVEVALGYLRKGEQEGLLKMQVLIPNGVDEFWFINIGATKKLESAMLRLLFVGEIIPRKNLETSIEAVKLLNDKGVRAELTIAGFRDPAASAYEKKIRQLCESYPFIRIKMRSGDLQEILSWYRDADIYVMPSHGETFGLTYVEAMTQGLPVIYSKGQGLYGYFEEGEVGFGVDAGRAEDVKDKVLFIRDNYDLMAMRALEKSRLFRWEGVAGEYAKLYKT